MRVCRSCGKTDTEERFYKTKPNKCSSCYSRQVKDYRDKNRATQRAADLRRVYNLEIVDYYRLFFKQGEVCAICHLPETSKDPKSGRTKTLAVDHDHTTGKVRGLLCLRCNQMLGYARDDPKILRNAVVYIGATRD